MRQAAVQTVPRRAMLAMAITMALLAALAAAPPAQSDRWPVWVAPAESVLPSGARILQALPVANALVVASPVAPPGAALTDATLQWKSLDLAEITETTSAVLNSGADAVNAPAAWTQTSGAGAVVALVDTGVAPVDAMAPGGPNSAVAGEIDFSGTGSGDGFGHGTFLASLIAGRDAAAPGVAPEALILSLKVADAAGQTDLSKVLDALQWLYGPGQASGIKIAVLALGVDPDTAAGQLLDRATATLASQGILVVTASGNDGADNLTSPATSPATVSVGALGNLDDDVQTYSARAAFSGTGFDRKGVAQPDLYAPGVRIAGSLSADSVIATQNVEAWVSGAGSENSVYLHGSGTSMATALTAGAAALASSHRPDLGGPELEAALRSTADRLDAPTVVQAAGSADVVESHPSVGRPGNAPAGKGIGNGKAKGPNEAANPQGIRWVDRAEWDGIRWVGIRWVGIRWVGIRWVDGSWGDEQWADDLWGGIRWVGIRWVGIRWVGIRWVDQTWESSSYAGIRWVDETWDASAYTGIRWVGVRWA